MKVRAAFAALSASVGPALPWYRISWMNEVEIKLCAVSLLKPLMHVCPCWKIDSVYFVILFTAAIIRVQYNSFSTPYTEQTVPFHILSLQDLRYIILLYSYLGLFEYYSLTLADTN